MMAPVPNKNRTRPNVDVEVEVDGNGNHGQKIDSVPNEGSPRSIILDRHRSYSYCAGCETSTQTIEDSDLCTECIEKEKGDASSAAKNKKVRNDDHGNRNDGGDGSSFRCPTLNYSEQARPTTRQQVHGNDTNSVSASFLERYETHVAERAAMGGGRMGGALPKPLNARQTSELVEEIKKYGVGYRRSKIDDNGTNHDHENEEAEKKLVELLTHRIPPGVDDAAAIKARYLSDVALEKVPATTLIRPLRAVELLGTMQGGYNVATLVELLQSSDANLRNCAAEQLRRTLLVFRAFDDVANLSKSSRVSDETREAASSVLESWADAKWFTSKPRVSDKMTVTVFKVSGETNTDDLSPAQDAWSRPDVPLHALAMLKNPRPGIVPENDGRVGPLGQMEELFEKGHPLAYVGDVVGTGSSRKSAANSVVWYTGREIPYVPNTKRGGVCIGGKIAPIFFNTMEDSGALPVEMDVRRLEMGDVVDIYPREGRVVNRESGRVVATFELKTNVLLDEVRAGGRIPLIIGRGLATKARAALGRNADASGVFATLEDPSAIDDDAVPRGSPRGFTLAQKIVGKACNNASGIRPGQYCEPLATTVGSQDTTGPMTRDELRSLACMEFTAGLVMQSFCHTAAYPRPIDLEMHETLPDFVTSRGGVSLRPGDGVIHAWLNRMLLPDTVGTGGDSHTRFPLGISFPAGSGLVAFAAATGTLPLDMPESILVRFTGVMQPGITLRDLVQSIPYTAIQKGLLTVDTNGKKNVFSGRIIEIEGLPDLTCEQAFELSDSSAERSAAGCTIKLSKDAVVQYLKSNVIMLRWMVSQGYESRETLERRIARMEEWLANPQLLTADDNAEYAEVIEINMDLIKEPILALPNDPDACALLSEVAGTKIDEVFLGSCMTNIGHFRAAGKLLDGCNKTDNTLPTKLWIAPPTKMDDTQLEEEGYLDIFKNAGARIEMPGCSLCMGNQARVAPNSTVVSTSTRNFPNRLGQGANVYLASVELAAIASIEGKLPSVEEYKKYMAMISDCASDTYRYLKFHELPAYVKASEDVVVSMEMRVTDR
mmetsp:Transcript_44275/g.93022  ORF Transcript_44275/g.93022 Transcript_44275/m.93022 type:complete len:1057 (+) Transcript_44275:419-3589(+)